MALLAVLEASDDLFCVAGAHGGFHRLNPAWQTRLGWRPFELRTRAFLDLVHPGDRPAASAGIEKLLKGRRPVNFESRYQRRDGSWIPLLWTLSPLASRPEFYALGRDLTALINHEGDILRILEQERERAGRELHDSLGPHLAALQLAATRLAETLRNRHQPEGAAAEELAALAREAGCLARSAAHAILPAELEGAGLSSALQSLAETCSRLTPLTVSYIETGNPQPVGRDTALHIYRIAQEALHNAARHAGAGKAAIVLHRAQGGLSLTVADDGSGLASSACASRGMGLECMRYRARAVCGRLEIDSHPGDGTVVRCEFPASGLAPGTIAP